MATTNNVQLNNLSLLQSTTVGFRGFFELTRAMKKAGWKYKASSDGTTKISSSDPAADQWGAGTTSNAGAAAASIAAPTRGRATVTGLTGIVAADKGRFLLISGATTGANNNQHQIEEVISSTSVRIDARNFAVASDASNGALTWSVRDPLGNNFNNSVFNMTTIAWWCAQGPSVLKIPITTASTGNFIKGENVVQDTTGAEGELLGYTYYNATGWLVIAPRLRGTGTGVYGWQTGNTVTGSKSGATVAQSGTALDYVWEVVFTKAANQTTIQILVGQFNTVADSAEMFSFCATQTGCTATVHPGGGGTGNAFGTHPWVVWGTGSGTAVHGAINGQTNSSLTSMINANVICVDAIPEQNYTADGSWTLFYLTEQNGSAGLPPAAGGFAYGLHRLNDIEDGEISPYVSLCPGAGKVVYTNTRTSAGTVLTVANNHRMVLSHAVTVIGGSTTFYSGWRGRGLTSEAFVDFEVAASAFLQSPTALLQARTGSLYAIRMQATANPLVKSRERMYLVNTTAPYNIVKGSFRWLYLVTGDQVTDTYGLTPGWVQLGTCSSIPSQVTYGAFVVGPYDGTPWTTQPGPN